MMHPFEKKSLMMLKVGCS
ncbi:hypothetical protein Zm00014a_032495 [Zea mays]|uniref:Uncharacterized protein n=1 Tax=Zea mays TaxID=4577 RepID=A0A317Y458_MAIZE|nr:hypothetical protein Zm00014a_032495 [Zea mays]